MDAEKEARCKGSLVFAQMTNDRGIIVKSARNKAWFALFTTPLYFVFVTVVIVPFFMGIYYSFFTWDGMPLNPKTFVGIDNFIRLLGDARFGSSILLTVKYTVIAVLSINLLGLFFALVVTSSLKTRNLARTIFFMPNLIGGLILGYVWKFIFTDGFKTVGEVTGLHGLFFNWLLNGDTALIAIVIVSTWQMAGYVMIVYVAGLQAISTEVVEAAEIDGAGYFRRLKDIIFPLLAPSFTICLFLSLSNSFKIFDVNLSLTKGGPANLTEMFAMNVYNEIFSYKNYGYGQAKAIVFFVVVAVISLTQVYLSKRREVEM